MGSPIDISDIEDYINVENFTLDLFKSKEYHLRKFCFCLLAALEDFVLEFDRNEIMFIEEHIPWIKFLHLSILISIILFTQTQKPPKVSKPMTVVNSKTNFVSWSNLNWK